MRVVAVAYSGGRDSTALLHATLVSAEDCGCTVVALHVHHGLNPAADDWLAHCAEQCRRWASERRPVAFDFVRLEDEPAAGESVEAWARGARYAALAGLAQTHGAGAVLLGHHRRDQAETLMLQALRGGGVAGLAGMPERSERDGIVWLRPWLRRSRDEIDAYVERHRLTHIDDDSNADTRFARNRLRLSVWPALVAAFPQAEAALAASAGWAQEADAALAELAAIDLAAIVGADGFDVGHWAELSAARRSLALRGWIRAATGVAASAALVQRLVVELPGKAVGCWPVAGGELVVWRRRLTFEPVRAAATGTAREKTLCVRRVGDFPLPGWGGYLCVERVRSGGVPLAGLADLELRGRQGGERFQSGAGRPPRSLKKQFQSLDVAPRDREGPLVYRAGQLVYVPGLGLDARALEPGGRSAVALHWRPTGASRLTDAG